MFDNKINCTYAVEVDTSWVQVVLAPAVMDRADTVAIVAVAVEDKVADMNIRKPLTGKTAGKSL